MSLSVNTGINKQKGKISFSNPNSAIDEAASDDRQYDELAFGQALLENEICDGHTIQEEQASSSV